MSAEVLRKAAALMRQRAKLAPDGPWYVYETFTHRCVGTGGFPNLGRRSHVYRRRRQVGFATESYPTFADHAASWHPAVALAVADWLDDAATDIEMQRVHTCAGRALAVARAYLGDADS